MAFSEFYITQDPGAAANNGGWPLGTNGGPIYETSLVTISKPGNHTLLVDGAGTWSNVYAGHWLTVVAGGSSYLVCVYDRTPGNALLVDPPIAVTDGTTGTARVGGAWDKLSSAIALLSGIGAANWPTGVDPPRGNIAYAGGNPYPEETAQINGMGTWSSLIPLRIEGYVSVPGDIDWEMDETRPVLDFRCVGINTLTTNTNLYNLKLRELAGASTVPLITNAVGNCYNCYFDGQGTQSSYIVGQLYGEFCRCILYRNSNMSGSIIVKMYLGGKIHGCHIIGNTLGTGIACYYNNTIENSVIEKCLSPIVMNNGSNGVLLSNTIVNNASHGITINYDASSALATTIKNNIIANNSGYGIYSSITGTNLAPNIVRNFFKSNTSGNSFGLMALDASNKTVSGDLFEDYINGDYRLKSTATDVLKKGFPLEMPDGTLTYSTPGVFIPQGSSGGVSRSRVLGGF